MNRHQYTKLQRIFLYRAISLSIIDAIDLVVMGANHQGSFDAIAEEICTAAYYVRHSGTGQTNHAVMVALYDTIAQEAAEQQAKEATK